MTSFKVTLTFDELPTLKTHKDLFKKEVFDRIHDNEYFTKNINYTEKSVTLKDKKVIFKFLSDNDDNRPLSEMKRWGDKNIKKSLAGRNKYYLDTYKVKKYKLTVKENKKLKKAIQDYKKEWERGGESRKLSLKRLKKKTKKLYGGSKKKCKSKKRKRRYSYTRRK